MGEFMMREKVDVDDDDGWGMISGCLMEVGMCR